MNTIHLQEWVEQLTEDLEDFANWWLDHVQRDEKDFPLELWHGDWDEQFDLFRQTRRQGQDEN